VFRRFQRPIIKGHSLLNKEIKQWFLCQKCSKWCLFATLQSFNSKSTYTS